jgi:hypothetical protein
VSAQKGSLIGQFIGESVFLAFLAGIVAIMIVEISLPGFNQLIQKKLSLDFTRIYTLTAFIGFILFTGLLAGSYPAFFLSSFNPVKVLKGTFKKANAFELRCTRFPQESAGGFAILIRHPSDHQRIVTEGNEVQRSDR